MFPNTKDTAAAPTTAATTPRPHTLDKFTIKKLVINDVIQVVVRHRNGTIGSFQGTVTNIGPTSIMVRFSDGKLNAYSIDQNMKFYHGSFQANLGNETFLRAFAEHRNAAMSDRELTATTITDLMNQDIACMQDIIASELDDNDPTLVGLHNQHSQLKAELLEHKDDILVEGFVDRKLVEQWQELNVLLSPVFVDHDSDQESNASGHSSSNRHSPK